MQVLSQAGAFTQQTINAINRNFAELQAAAFGGWRKIYYVDPVNGRDNLVGSHDEPMQNFQTAYNQCVDGRGDAVALVGDGATTGSVRLEANFAWAKNNTHLFGISSGTQISGRARIAPTAGITAFANFFTLSGNGCQFVNVSLFHGFDTGVSSAIALAVSGGRNKIVNCHIAGMGDAESAANTGSRCLHITGGENEFHDTVIGVDTVGRGVANANISFAASAARNMFKRCQINMLATQNTVLGISVPVLGIDRYAFFDELRVMNSLVGGGTAITGLATLAASAGGHLVFRDPFCFGVTTYGTDATSDAQIRVGGGVIPTNGALIGLSVAPAA